MLLPPKAENPVTLIERCAAYVATMPGAVSGQNGHDKLFEVACRLVHGFGLSVDEAVALLKSDYNPRCVPEWTDAELLHKCEDAKNATSHEKPKLHLVGDEPISASNGRAAEPEKTAKKPPVMLAGSSVLAESMLRIENDETEVIFNCGDDLEGFELGPGKITVVGAPPGTGKTSLASQAAFAAIEHHPDLRLTIANAEMDPGILLRREMSRRSGVNYQKLRFATYDAEEKLRLQDAGMALTPLMKRTELMTPPYQIERLVEGLPSTPGLLVLDYLQKFRSHKEAIEGIEAVMGMLRWVAMSGWAILALSSTARQDGGSKGGKHDASKLDMGSFRGSGEIEFQADAAYVLRDLSGDADGDRDMQLDCVKNRHGARASIELVFRASEMRFEGPINNPQKHDFGDDW